MNFRLWTALVAAALLLAGKPADAPTTPGVEPPASLRAGEALARELAGMGAVDQLVRTRYARLLADAPATERAKVRAVYARDIAPLDRAHTERLKNLLQGRGWFSPSEVGDQAANAAFLIVQHSGDIALMKLALSKMEDPALKGQIPSTHTALLYDRIALMEGRLQRFGTQVSRCENGRYVPPDVEDAAGLDARRSAAGLPPMKDYLQRMQSVGGCFEAPAATK